MFDICNTTVTAIGPLERLYEFKAKLAKYAMAELAAGRTGPLPTTALISDVLEASEYRAGGQPSLLKLFAEQCPPVVPDVVLNIRCDFGGDSFREYVIDGGVVVFDVRYCFAEPLDGPLPPVVTFEIGDESAWESAKARFGIALD